MKFTRSAQPLAVVQLQVPGWGDVMADRYLLYKSCLLCLPGKIIEWLMFINCKGRGLLV